MSKSLMKEVETALKDAGAIELRRTIRDVMAEDKRIKRINAKFALKNEGYYTCIKCNLVHVIELEEMNKLMNGGNVKLTCRNCEKTVLLYL